MIASAFARWAPFLSIIVALAVQEAALPWPGWSNALRPDLVLIALLYWRIYRPDRCGPSHAFIAGLMLDLLSGAPIGLNAFTKTLAVTVVGFNIQRLREASFLMLMPLIALSSFVDQQVQWLLVKMLDEPMVRGHLFWGKPLATMLFAPLLAMILVKLHHAKAENWRKDPNVLPDIPGGATGTSEPSGGEASNRA